MKPEFLHLQQLLNKDTWTEEETEWVRAYLDHDDTGELRQLLQEVFHDDLSAGKKIDPAISTRMREYIFSTADSAEPIPKSRGFRTIRTWQAAAAIVLLAGAGLLTYREILHRKHRKEKVDSLEQASVRQQRVNRHISPGGDKAMLRLANGSTIVLDSARNGNLASEANTSISKLDGKLSYTAAPAPAGGLPSAAVTYDMLTTPKGGQYQIVLQDGTRVWLNAASSLKFPTTFTGSDRQVEMTGEAYFEVAKNKDKPFRVLVNHRLQANVLGTDFNIMAYEEEPAVTTTLVNGSVQLVQGQASVLLKPDQQASLLQEAMASAGNVQDGHTVRASAFHVTEANIETALAWKNGIFQFDNLPIQTIMRQIARWYDVDISYQTNLQDQVYSGSMPRKENIAELLKILEYTGTVHFAIEGKTIIVTK